MRYLFVLLMFVSSHAFAQYKDYMISVNGDTLNRVDMKGRKQGPWVIKIDDLRGERGYEEQGYFVNNKREGKWTRFSLEGDLLAVENYRWGNKDGKNVYYSNMGDPLREESWKAVNPDSPYDTINVYDVDDPSKVVGKQVVKLKGFSLKHGTWRFYDPLAGSIEKTENRFLDKPAKKTGVGDDDLAPIDVANNSEEADAKPAVKKTTAKPKEVMEFEKKNSGKKKVKMRDGSTGG